MASRGRPEHSGPPDLFYNDKEAMKYTQNSHIIDVQEQLSERALELLALPADGCLLADLGCGSGLSGQVLSDAGHRWIGVDISAAMLDVATERDVDGDLLQLDLGCGVPFRAGVFDGAISISALQWLCNADSRDQQPRKRLYRFFASLYACLARGSRAVFQFYPETEQQTALITQQATRAGFTGGVVIDYPNSAKAKKLYLVLFTGGAHQLPRALDAADDNVQIRNSERLGKKKYKRAERCKKPPVKSREWIEERREKARRQGKEVRAESRYTGRKRRRL